MNDSDVTLLPISDAHVVILVNYIRRHHVVVFKELAKRVKRLTILLSTPMEPDRSWKADWDDLAVLVQKNWMLTLNWHHSSGFREPNFIHIPIDTTTQLNDLKPDIVFSYELGMRTLLCARYCRRHRDVPLVMVGNMSEHIERERGWMRRMFRQRLCRRIDYFTYNGPSCKRYLASLGIGEHEMFHVPYCFDPDKSFAGEKQFSRDGVLRLVYCGSISQRKGILQFAQVVRQWAEQHAHRSIELNICGTGPLHDAVAACQADNFSIRFSGDVDSRELRSAYRDADICVFPTLADEWGLVPVEAMASGLSVLGSRFAQSIEELCVDGENGWSFSPLDQKDTLNAIECAFAKSPDQLAGMGQFARQSVKHITPEYAAEKISNVIHSVLAHSPTHPTTVARPSKVNSPS